MSLIDLLARLREQDIHLRVEDGRLRYSAPAGGLPEALRAGITAHKAELIAFLTAGTTADGPRPVPRAADGTLPASPVQERLWLLDRMEPGNPSYHMPAAVRLTGTLDPELLERAVNRITARHEVLRTSFEDVGGRPRQRVHAERYVPLVRHDLRELPEPERTAEVERRSEAEAAAPFDLARDPLLRTTLLRTGEDEHVLLLTLHHIVADGWSVSVLANELAAHYRALTEDRPADLPALPVQYGDYAAWHTEWLDSEACAAQLDRWRERLGGELPDLVLPLDVPRPAVRTFRAGRAERTLPAETAEGLRRMAQESGATLFTVMLAAFKVLLHRLSGQDDLIVGIPEAGRTRSEIEPLVGFFVNTLALRTDLSGDPAFRDLLGQVRDTAYDAYADRDLPFERILIDLQPKRRLDRTPVFQVFFNMVPFAEQRLDLPGLTARFLHVPDAGAKFDLTLYAGLDGRALTLVHNADLFTEERAEQLLDAYVALAAQIVADPGRPLSSYSLVTERARAVLPDPARPLAATWKGGLAEAFAERARTAPDRVAIEEPDGSWTYGQLAGRAHGLAHRLRAEGVAPGDVVALYGPRGSELACAMLGTLAAGAAFLVLDTAEPAARVAEQASLAAPRGLVCTGGAEAPAELLDAVRATAVSRPVLPRGDEPDRLPVGPPHTGLGADSPAYLAFTSGSTGRPKAVLGTHGPLAHFADWFREAYGLTAEDRFALLSAPGHDPMLRDVLVPLALGATVCVPDHASLPGRFAEWAEDRRITLANLTPATLEYLLGGRAAAHTAATLRYLFFGGDRLRGHHVTLARSLNPGVRCVNFYGATETPQAMSAYEVPAGEPAAEIPLGPGTPGSQLVLLNAAGEQAGVGELAEIHVRSPHLSAGYPADPELTAARFLTSPVTGDPADRWFRTGDLGRYQPDGTVRFCGRADRQIQIRGFRVEPAEAEARLRQHPGVADCVVRAEGADAGDGTEGAEPRLVAHWTPAGGAAPAPRELREHMGAVLPDHLVPAAFVRLDALPLLPNGKVDLASLPPAPPAERDADEVYVAPVTEVEKTLAAIWEDVLGVDKVGVNDDFFDLGGHSLLATVVTHRVREALGTEIAVRTLFEDRTVAGLAKVIEQQGDAATAGAPGPIRSVARTEAGLDDLLARLGALTDGEG
ncbi:amino acid adenylation domain-containing protein [Streptomyces albidoflavus]|uniref:non-ribosomal peptide synthetase n=1 Tax=Streptomyces albidoflavus TaxID=1886 RepID=UPI000FF35D41|nr:non-ribosomal peptide synthetase [Streptomyces albidoflavus]RWZ77833.1 amino acid adenylation domain-containing protein [Streptomyces albidoflavus]